MDKKYVSQMPPKEKISFDGERCTPWLRAPAFSEHLHRYLSVIEHIRDRSVLDVACGEGYGSAILAQNGAKYVVGVDVDPEIVERAQRVYQKENLEFKFGDVRKLSELNSDSFDVITCFETIEHVKEHEEVISELSRLLKRDGLLVISTPDRIHPASQNSQNPFHEKELSLDEFSSLIQGAFDYVTVGYQRTFFGSLFSNEEGKIDNNAQYWQRTSFTDYVGSEKVLDARYIVIWASNAQKFEIPTGLMHDRALGEILIKAGREFGVD